MSPLSLITVDLNPLLLYPEELYEKKIKIKFCIKAAKLIIYADYFGCRVIPRLAHYV